MDWGYMPVLATPHGLLQLQWKNLCLTWQRKKKFFFLSPQRIEASSTEITASGLFSADKQESLWAAMPRVWEYTPSYSEIPQSSQTPMQRPLLCLAQQKWAGWTEVWLFFVCLFARLIVVHGDSRKTVKSWIKMGHNNKLSLENKTNLYGNKERKERHIREKRIGRETMPEGGQDSGVTNTKLIFRPLPPPGTDGRAPMPLTSSAVTMAITFAPCSHTICQKSWHVCGRGPWVAM